MADAICQNCRYFKAKAGEYGDCLIHNTTVHYGSSGIYCSCFHFKDNCNKEDKSMSKDVLEEHFVKGVEKCNSPEDILNWYRNFYYKEDDNSERRIIAEAINDFFVKKLPQLIKETRLTTISSVQSRIELAIENNDVGLCLYEDTLRPTILEYRNEVKNDKV